MKLIDEEVIEAAFWHFDAERKRTGAERDAFKHHLRSVVQAHIASVCRLMEETTLYLTAYTTGFDPPGGMERARQIKRKVTAMGLLPLHEEPHP
jgi:hypothetical protein